MVKVNWLFEFYSMTGLSTDCVKTPNLNLPLGQRNTKVLYSF